MEIIKDSEIKDVRELVLSEQFPREVLQDKEKDFLETLKLFAPGTSIRSSLDDLLSARMGALIVVANENTHKIIEKGFRINAKFSHQKVVELAKMDGAIILSSDLKKILYANALLFPSVEVQTKETGTRHKAAERTARQAGALVIAVSERKNKITLYYKDLKYELQRSSEILRRASETLQILEKQKEIYNDLIANLNLLEIENLVTVNDLCTILQRLEILKRISSIVRRYLIELGKEGMVVSMRLKELIGNLNKEEGLILKDYFNNNSQTTSEVLERMSFDSLLEITNISSALFRDFHDKVISPKGERLLDKTRMPEDYLRELINRFDNLDKILSAGDGELLEVFRDADIFHAFNKKLSSLKEKIVMGKDIGNLI